jgi:hypothetical protein
MAWYRSMFFFVIRGFCWAIRAEVAPEIKTMRKRIFIGRTVLGCFKDLHGASVWDGLS